jgi:GAF domain-containing protein
VPPDHGFSPISHAAETALQVLATSAVDNIPGVDFASITLHGADHTLRTVAATDALAEQSDAIQYQLREGPCYATVTDERLVLVNDVATSTDFPLYGPRAAELGVRSQAAIQLIHNGDRAGLNLYARQAGAFDRSIVQLAELFSAHAAALLHYARQVEQLGEAIRTRTDIGTAVGILMERYGIDKDRAFGFLVRNSSHRNIKVRELAKTVIDGTFESTSSEDTQSQEWP